MATTTQEALSRHHVLNAGCGPYMAERLHPIFRKANWNEVRLDIDERVHPDLIGSIADMTFVQDARFDAIWCSHNLEHLHTWQVGKALSEFRRVLKPSGFVLLRSPDLEAIAQLVVSGNLESVAYQSPAGPITALDMIFGHSRSVEQGNEFMAHNTGFTAERLGRLLLEAGFSEARVRKDSAYDLWAIAMMPRTDKANLLNELRANGLGALADE